MNPFQRCRGLPSEWAFDGTASRTGSLPASLEIHNLHSDLCRVLFSFPHRSCADLCILTLLHQHAGTWITSRWLRSLASFPNSPALAFSPGGLNQNSSPLTDPHRATQLRGMKLAFYQFLHVASMVLLVAVVFQGFANPDPKTRKRTLRNAGILALTMLIGGFGLVAVMKVGFPWWVIVKTVCWLGIASISGFGYRKPERIPLLTGITAALVAIAIATVYFRNAGAAGFE